MANKEKTLEELKVEAELAQKAYATALKAEEQKKKAEEEKKRAELAAVREKREEEIADLMSKLEQLLVEYNRDYGAYRTNRSGIFGSLWPIFI